MKKILILAVCCYCTLAYPADQLLYKDPKQSIEKRVNDLIGRMTLEEKVYQLCALFLSEGDEIYKATQEYSIDKTRKELLKGFGSVSVPSREMYAKQAAETNNALQKIAMELKAFDRIHLKPGESKSVKFELKASDFIFLNEELKQEVDNGEYTVLIGKNSNEGINLKLVIP